MQWQLVDVWLRAAVVQLSVTTIQLILTNVPLARIVVQSWLAKSKSKFTKSQRGVASVQKRFAVERAWYDLDFAMPFSEPALRFSERSLPFSELALQFSKSSSYASKSALRFSKRLLHANKS